MTGNASIALLFLLLLPHGCSGAEPPQPVDLKYKAAGESPQVLAVYEAWFGHPKHISPSTMGYSSHDPAVIRHQMEKAKAKFKIAMMYDETNEEDGATDEAIADLTMFHATYLSHRAAGRDEYLTYQGRPVIFIFPTAGHTDWDRVKAVVSKWDTPPFLIDENLPGPYADGLDGFYAWVNPGPKGWTADGSNWGEEYLSDFYQTMVTKYPNKIIVGGAWSQFDDHKAAWSLNRHMSARCGQTFQDTSNYWRKYVPATEPIPFVLIATWNDYEEGTAIEGGIPTCTNTSATLPTRQ